MNPRKGLLLVLGKGKRMDDDSEERSSDAEPMSDNEAYVDAVGELIEAIKNGDKKLAARSLQDAMALCPEGYEEDSEQEDDKEEEAI